jgi:hypothetical protein
MRLTSMILALSIAFLFASCKKEPISDQNFIGHWKCENYTYVYWSGPDTALSYSQVVNEPCYMDITSEGGSEFYFGLGTAKMPLNLGLPGEIITADMLPTMVESPFAIQESSDYLDGRNNWDYVTSTVEYGADRQLRGSCSFKMINKNRMNVKVYLNMALGQTHPYTYALLEFIK